MQVFGEESAEARIEGAKPLFEDEARIKGEARERARRDLGGGGGSVSLSPDSFGISNFKSFNLDV